MLFPVSPDMLEGDRAIFGNEKIGPADIKPLSEKPTLGNARKRATR